MDKTCAKHKMRIPAVCLFCKVEDLDGEIEQYQRWINDLVNENAVSCVHCGETYGRQGMPADHLGALFYYHSQRCPKKPDAVKYDSPWLLAALLDSFQHEPATTPWGACVPMELLKKCKIAVEKENK